MSLLSSFYDRYHKKNADYVKVIGENNFTYYYTLQFLKKASNEKFANKKILDIGCGVGALSLYLASKGAEVEGIDISPRAIEICKNVKKTLELKNAEFTQGQLNKGKATKDIVICSEIIEHIQDDGKFLELVHSHLNSQGKLFLSTPSSENVLHSLGFYRRFDKEVGHLRRYTHQSLKLLLEKHGFQVLELRSVEGPLRNILFTTPLGFFIRFIKGPLVPLFHFFDELSALLFGASDIQVIAEKK